MTGAHPRALAGAPVRELALTRLDSVHALDGEWDRLAGARGNIFGSPEFLRLWWQHYGNGRLQLWSARSASGRLLALFPLYEWRSRPLRILRFAGHGAGDELGPLMAADCNVPETARALRRVLARIGAAVLVAEHLPAQECWPAALGATWSRRTGSPVLPLRHESWDAYLATRSSNFRQFLRRHERKLARERRLVFRRADASTLEADLASLFHLHALRWQADTNFLRRRAFHEAFARAAHERGWLRLWILELEGRPAAAWYGFRFGASDAFYQSGRDPRWDHVPVGAVLLAHTIRLAIQEGQREYRFLKGDEPYKYRFTDADAGLESLLVGRGVAGTGVTSAAAALWRVRRWIRTATR